MGKKGNETEPIKDWMDRVEDALFREMLRACKIHDHEAAKAWAEALARVGMV